MSEINPPSESESFELLDSVEDSHINKSKNIYLTDDITLIPDDTISIIYANPINNNIHIRLGRDHDHNFPPNYSLLIKDCTLEYGPGTDNNIFITVPVGTTIENYGPDGGLTATNGGTYKLNTSGGSVKLLHTKLNRRLPGWVIESQFNGNPRLLALKFTTANESDRSKILNSMRDD